MKRLLEIPEYVADVRRAASLDMPWEKLRGKTILITGGTGLIGSFLIDVLNAAKLGCTILLLGRSEEKARTRFAEYWDSDLIRFVKWDAAAPTLPMIDGPIDFVLHLASNTHPVAYVTDPIGTITTNVLALNNLLALASERNAARFLFASSNEIYGENRGDVELFDEKYCGYIDCNTLRAGYPESKRCGEALCQAYLRQRGLDCVIARLTRTYGPTILPTDTKAISQFFNNALRGEDIVLKSEGRQYYSYQYVADSVSGLLTVLLKGETGEAYNIADESGDITLRDLAKLIAENAGCKVVFDLPEAVEAAGFSKATKARLKGDKLKMLGWRFSYGIEEGIIRTMKVLRIVH
ncbi:MAG: NAD-dependent epimerase/dehydratase family protein [Kiritimatiellae bacterium]|nr:NAD-dependent epimerase/dehydratase family protein [Kiritimatiellia bacterium]